MLRAEGVGVGPSMFVLTRLGYPLDAAKRIVLLSPVWQEQLPEVDRLHDEAEAAVQQLARSEPLS